MKLIRFKAEDEIKYGILEENKVKEIKGDIFEDYQVVDKSYQLLDLELLAPCEPSKIICVGLNYKDHAEEMGEELPEEPVIFMKPATAVSNPNQKVKYPKMSKQVDYEAELAIVIKDEIKDLRPAEVEEHILGYTCFNDITARDLQSRDGQWIRAKSFDGFAPLGPVIATELAANNLGIQLIHNGEIKQDSNTNQMIFSLKELVSFISQVMTLKPGDVIATGTPPGVGSVEIGDKLEVKIEGIGSLINEISE
ncbi:2-keto-4-pentenoate hydratase/2-oxohepta-3-ene-1,7-dioic acid hydratase in catechol pathway [Orenia metallireducens]|jgi:2-keto-4-pentenoate hydratase/2-oxohepta-3-ene-1,7-dioic acid hydratase in catechol pathway|uniref:2-keto-4-pentenoate hydratase/2-oxohepta-3-ene-1,7-dioic acid hydratase (Catechol pathway) n=1 Tax=Orenia metallireducens TaxID=1413210 RepID=A0A285H752_9FIRM|nr:fumarylacetoacetate hydrolase family protein [Orenia metallireducens]PRX21132.1 2-keto-4-pentenoate hydratase/2-oxohepta-3-ene-1,7-dioic acid hydratase in catechol pathway [Orenia metallireducens]SNY31592.1 2-keto-4-pentenoate hydratase/2-oxohepta-3-ene-1,7-dioic acid hydratase (catechol pathway) [Orenia metallireducens]